MPHDFLRLPSPFPFYIGWGSNEGASPAPSFSYYALFGRRPKRAWGRGSPVIFST
jgi:hypothetical protein